MNILGDVGKIGRKSGFELCELFVVALFFSLCSEVYTITMEWSFVSPHQLSQQLNQQNANKWYSSQDGDVANVDFSKGGQIAFVPATYLSGSTRYGLYNRPVSPREINVYLSKPKHRSESSSEEHKRKHHRDPSDEDYPDSEPEHHHEDHHTEHHQHHESPAEELNDEHAEQAQVAGQMADLFNRMIEAKKSQVYKHVEMRDEELNRGNEEAAKKEQAIIDIYQKQIEYLQGIEKAEEAIMAGEIDMYHDGDGHGHHGHHQHQHDTHEPDHHHKHHNAAAAAADDDDDDDGYGDGHNEDDDIEGKHEHGHHGHDDNGNHHHGGDDHHGNDHDGHDHHGNDHDGHDHHGNDHDGHEHHTGGEGHHGHDGHHNSSANEGGNHQGNQNEDEYQDAQDQFKNDDDNEPSAKHKVDRRSPSVTSYLLPFTSSDASSPLPVEADVGAETAVTTPSPTPDPSSTNPTTAQVSSTVDASVSTPSTKSAVSASSTDMATSSSSNSNSGWLSWFGASSDNPQYSPYGLLKYLSPSDKSADNLMSMFNVFSDPSNSSYLSNASTLMRIIMFFMPGTGIVDQVYFTMALSKIMWEAATMYYDGYGTTEIAVIVLGEMAKAAYLGETIKIDGMDVPAFLKYVKNMKYPDLTEAQEEKLRKDIDNLVTMTYPNISPELKTTFCAGLGDTLKFLSLFGVEGDLKVDNVDVNFSEVYIKMHSAFEDSPLEKIKKSILSAIDTIKSQFQ